MAPRTSADATEMTPRPAAAAVGRPARARRALLAAALYALGAVGVTGVGCAPPEPPLFDPRGIELGERRQAGTNRPERMDPFPTTLESTPTPSGLGIGTGPRPATQTYLATLPATGRTYAEQNTVPLTLREVITRAVLYNADVKVAGYEPAIAASRAVEAEAAFDPAFFFNLRNERNDTGLSTATNVAANQLAGFQRITRQSIGEGGLRQRLPFGGEGRLLWGLTWNELDQVGDGQTQRFWQNNLRLEITQPLLRDFGRDINSARIDIARGDQRISLLDFRKTLEEQLSELERAYWQLFQFVRIVAVQETLLADTIETYRVLRERNEKGLDVAEISVAQALSNVKSRQADLIQAKQNVRDLSDEVKRRMGDPAFPISSDVVIYPSEEPLRSPLRFDYQAAMDSAAFNRFELGQQQARIEQARIAETVAVNNLLPQLNFVGRFGFVGLGQSTGEAIKNNDDFNSPSWAFGIELEYPIGNRSARAILNRARLQRTQAVQQYGVILQDVARDVRQSMNVIQSSWEQSIARDQARRASERQLALIQRQQDVGEPMTLQFVQIKLQAQEERAQAARSEAEAIANYNIAIQRLERAKGTLLKYNNVQLREDPSQTYLRRAWAE